MTIGHPDDNHHHCHNHDRDHDYDVRHHRHTHPNHDDQYDDLQLAAHCPCLESLSLSHCELVTDEVG